MKTNHFTVGSIKAIFGQDIYITMLFGAQILLYKVLNLENIVSKYKRDYLML